MEDLQPSKRLQEFMTQGKFKAAPFHLLQDQLHTEQSLRYHPEGSVWNHTLLVVDEAARRKEESTKPRLFMWAALLHDSGKPATTKNKNGKITAYNHDQVGAKLVRSFLGFFSEDEQFIHGVTELVRYHMQPLYVLNELPFQDIAGMKRQTDIHDVALLGLCDRLGRKGSQKAAEEKNIARFLEKCR